MTCSPAGKEVGGRSPQLAWLLAERRVEGRRALNAHHELRILDKRSVEVLPADHSQLVERVGLIGPLKVGELLVVENDLRVSAPAEDEGRIDRDAGRRGRGGDLENSGAGDDRDGAGRELRRLPRKRTLRRTRRRKPEVGHSRTGGR